MIKIYHVFADGVDDFIDTRKEAVKAYRELCKDYDNVRLYVDTYANQQAVNDDVYEEEYLLGKGDFPL